MSQTASTSDVQALKSEVQQLQRRIDQLEADQAAAAQSAPRRETPAGKEAPVPSTPAITAGPLTLTFGGFMALESVYRNKNETADIGSNYSTGIPFTYQPNAHISEFRESARQSRFSLLAEGPRTGPLSAEGYLETDFLSAGVSSNSAESNSYTLRMRQFYGVLRDSDADWYVLGGQTWSLATMYNEELNPRSERVVQTIDAQYVTGFNWTRNAQLRFVKNFGKMITAGLSIESPQASFYTGCNSVATPAPAGCASPPSAITTNPGGSLLNSTANYSIDFAPDIIAKVAVDPGYGHYEVYGLARGFRDHSPGTASGTNHSTWGGSFGGGLVLPIPLPTQNLEFQASALAGAGNGRYGSAQLPDATLRPDGTVAAIREWQALAGLVYKPMPELTVYAYAGEEAASRTAYANAAGTAGIGYGSPLYNNGGCYLLTGTAGTCIADTRAVQQLSVGEWWKVYQGSIGNVQVGLQYSYLDRKTFSGVGGDPSATIHMGFVSFRYYPYQR
ncbi:MAG TPA: hypothetical protein VHY75_00855 [Steroidobacteraceae bacterium]|nr:hypothetical protein [Steroidobacteraceae bacterium]